MLTLKLPHTFSVLLAAVLGAWKRNLMKVDKVCCYRLGDLPISQTKYMYQGIRAYCCWKGGGTGDFVFYTPRENHWMP